MDVEIRPADVEDRDAWLTLIQALHEEYELALSADVAFDTWDRVINRSNPVRSRVAVTPSGEVVGFGNYVIHASTWSENDVCYIEDVYVDEAHRRHGIGAAIVRDIVRIGHISKLHAVYTVAQMDDDGAQAFADGIAEYTGLVRYDFKV